LISPNFFLVIWFSKGIEFLPQFSNPFIFTTLFRRPLKYQSKNTGGRSGSVSLKYQSKNTGRSGSVRLKYQSKNTGRSGSVSLKYQRFIPSDC